MSKYILAYDFGTSGVKAGLFRDDGYLAAESYQTYDTAFPAPGWAQENPQDWWSAFKKSTADILDASNVDTAEIAALGFSSMRNAFVCVDKDGRLLRESAMVWMDTRAERQGKQLSSMAEEDRLYDVTGIKAEKRGGTMAARVLWLKENEPEVYRNTHRFLGTPEYIILRLSEEMGCSSFSSMSCYGFFNIHTGEYDEKLMEAFGLNKDQFCVPTELTTVVAQVSANGQRDTGIPSGTPIVIGAWDNICCVIGAGGATPGNFVSYLGTAAWLGTLCGRCLTTRTETFMPGYAGKGLYYNSINSHSSGVAYDWVVSQMFHSGAPDKAAYAVAEEAASSVPAGADGVMFLPSFFGGNSVFDDPRLSATIVGLRARHTKAHILRAVMEGVGMDMLLGAQLFHQCGEEIQHIRLIGGGAKNNLWASILASMFEQPLLRIENAQHSGVRGAMAAAGIGIGLYKDYTEVNRLLVTESVVEPVAAWSNVYKKEVLAYREIYKALLHVLGAPPADSV
ncbi:MAG: FGGY family carbohydrate kinase [Oscillospiraceae bacterium]|nr:FGGY family carbohydrate kinase [Oscillospiraceae bacterium]